MKREVSFFFLVLISFYSCSSDDSSTDSKISLEEALRNKEFSIDNVIACAASNIDSNVVSVFLYPRSGVSNINFYQTKTVDVDKNDFAEYTKGEGDLIDVFNGYLLKYEIVPEQEKWIIVSFEERGEIHLSNPIRLKQTSKPTEYLSENVRVQSSNMPVFTWQDGVFDDTKIYFHVVSNANNDLLSGTYTFEKRFQYYKLDNVVLNITEEIPPILETGESYDFTLLAVSEDNWVNLFSTVPFNIP